VTKGRPSKFTPEIAKIIIEALEEGATFEAAAGAAGITWRTLLGWRQKGEAAAAARDEHGVEWWKPKGNDLQFLQFFQAIKTALDHSEALLLSRIVTAGKDPDHWQANAWILERRFPKKWGKTVKLSGDPENPLVPAREMSDEEIEKRAREILERRRSS